MPTIAEVTKLYFHKYRDQIERHPNHLSHALLIPYSVKRFKTVIVPTHSKITQWLGLIADKTRIGNLQFIVITTSFRV